MQRQDFDSDENLPAIMSNMVNKGKMLIIEEYYSNIEMEETHHHAYLKTSTTAPCDYRRLAGGSNEEYEEHSDYLAIATL